MYYVGGTIAAFSIGFLAERYGRKWAIAAVSNGRMFAKDIR